MSAVMPPPGGAYYTDAEVDSMCDGLTQDAAKIRFLRSLGLRVDRKPNGRPLAWRPAAVAPGAGEDQNQQGLNVVGLQAWAANRKGRNGQKTQGR